MRIITGIRKTVGATLIIPGGIVVLLGLLLGTVTAFPGWIALKAGEYLWTD